MTKYCASLRTERAPTMAAGSYSAGSKIEPATNVTGSSYVMVADGAAVEVDAAVETAAVTGVEVTDLMLAIEGKVALDTAAIEEEGAAIGVASAATTVTAAAAAAAAAVDDDTEAAANLAFVLDHSPTLAETVASINAVVLSPP